MSKFTAPSPWDTYEAFVGALATADAAAEQSFIRHFQRPLASLLLARCQDPHLAQDLLQDTFHRLLQRLRDGAVREPEKLPGYVHATAQNVWIEHIRKERRRQTESDTTVVEQTLATLTPPASLLQSEQAGTIVRRLLEELPVARDRELLRRAYLLDQDKAVICIDLDLEPTHYDRVIYRARKRFREILEEQHDSPAIGDFAEEVDHG